MLMKSNSRSVYKVYSLPSPAVGHPPNMGHTTSLTFWSGTIFLVLQICKLTSAALTFNADASKAYQDVAQGAKNYAVFKPSQDLSTFSLVKVSAGDFNSLTTDLLASKEDVLGAYSNVGKAGKELYVLVWVATGNNEEVGQKYSAVVDELEKLFSKDIVLSLISDLPSDFNLTYLHDSAAEGYNRIISSSEYGESETTEVVTVNVQLKPSIQEVSLGSKRYVIFKFSDDFSSIVLDKVGDLTATFADLAADLKKYEAAGEVRIVIYFVPVVKDGVVGNKVLLIFWAPSTADKTLVSKYQTKLKSLTTSLNVPIWDEVTVKTTTEVTPEGINKLLPANTGQIVTTTTTTTTATTDEVVKVDASVQTSVNEVSQGSKRYVVLKFSDDFSSVVVDKVGDLSADFASLALYLKQFEGSGQLRVVFYFVPVLKDGATQNKLLLLLWTPSTADKTLVTKYLLKLKGLKSTLKVPVWNEVTVKSATEVTPESVNKLLPANTGQVVTTTTTTPTTDEVVKVDASVQTSVNEVSQGSKRYVVLKFSDEFSSVVVDKVGDLSADFASLALYLKQFEGSGQLRVVFYFVPVLKDGATQNKLLLLLWTPSTADKTLVTKYLLKLKGLKSTLKVPVWNEVTVKSATEVTPESVNKLLPANTGQVVTTTTTTPTTDEVVKVDASVQTSVNEVSQGSKRYVVLKFSDDFNSVVVDKVGDLSADFASLALHLKQFEGPGQLRVVFYYLPVLKDGATQNKLLLLLWTPSTADKTLVTKYLLKLKGLKTALKVPAWNEVTVKSVTEVSPEGVNKLLPAGSGQVQEPVKETPVVPEKVEVPEELSDEDDDEPAQLEPSVDTVVEDVKKGTKKYVTLKWTPTNTLVVDKTGAPDAKFDDLVKDLVNAEKAGEGRYAFFNDNGKLLLVVWAPSTLTDKQKLLYKKKLVKVKKLLKKNFSYVVPRSAQELDLPKLLKTAKDFDYPTFLSKQGKTPEKPAEEDDEVDDEEPAQLEPNVDTVVEDVKKGTKKYVTLKWTPTNTLVVDKTGAPSAKFDDLVKDLVDAEKTGEGRYAFFNDNGKLLLVVWAPSTLPDKQKVLYKKKLVKVKKLLKKNFSYVLTQSAQELDLPKLLKTVKEFDYPTFLSKQGKKPVKPSEEDEDVDDDEPAQLEPNVDTVVEDVKKGTKKYVTLKWTPTNTLVVDKTGAPSAKFDDLVKDLIDAEKAGEGRYAFYNDNGKLLLVVWAPLTLPDKQKVLYKKKLVKVKKLLKKNFSYVAPQSVPELDLPKLLKTVKDFDYPTFLSKQGKKPEKPVEEEEEEDDDEPAELDPKVDPVVEDVKKGTKKYVTLKWTPKNTLVVDKTGAPTAKFDDLVKDLVDAEKAGEGRYAFYNDNGNLLLVVWAPSTLPDKQKVLYKKKLVKVKKLLKKDFSYAVPQSVQDLDLPKLQKTVKVFDFVKWFSKVVKKVVKPEEEEDEDEDDDEPADLDPKVDPAVEDVKKGTKKYVTLKWTPKNTLVVDKTGAPTAKFDDLVKDLVDAEKAGEGRYAFYNDNGNLLLVVWAPSTLPDKQKVLYKKKLVKVKKLLKKDFSYAVPQSVQDLDLPKLQKTVKVFDFVKWFSKVVKKVVKPEEEDEDEDDDEPADLDPKVDPAVEDVKKGTKKYVTLKWTPKNTLVVDKTGAPTAKFDDLVKDLVDAEKAGEGRYAFYNDNGNLLLVVWAPSTLPDKQKVLYKKKLIKVKKLLKKDFSYAVPQSVQDLDLPKLQKTVKVFDFVKWFSKVVKKVVKPEEEEDEDEDDDEPADLDPKVDPAVEDVKKGTKKYVTLKWTPKNTLVVDKTGAPTAKFDDLVKDLVDAEKAGEGRYAFYNDNGNLLLVVWAPSTLPDKQKVLYKKKLVKVKKLLKKDFSYAVPQSVQDLDLPKLQKTVKVFDFVKWFSKVVKKVVKPEEEEDEDEDDDEPADLDPKVDPAVEDVKKGTKKYVTLKWTPKNTLVVDKTGAPTAKFDDLVKDLVDAEKAGEGRYAFYNDNGNLLLVVWAPSTLPDKQKVLYKKKLVKVKKLLKKDFSYAVPQSVQDLDLPKLQKTVKVFDFVKWFSKVVKKVVKPEEEDEDEDDDEPADLDPKVDPAVEDVKKGTKKYVTLKWTPKNTLVVDKTGAPTAKFDDLVKDLVDAEKAGEGRYAFYNDNGNLLLVVWAPSTLPDKQKVLYKKKLVKVKKLLKKDFSYAVPQSVQDLDLPKLQKTVKVFDFVKWFSKVVKKVVKPEEEDEDEDDDEPADLDPKVDPAVEDVKKGTKKYVTLKWTPKNTLVVDKTGAPTAKFDDLVKDLVDAEKAGEGRYAFYNDNGNLLLVVWAPSTLPDKQKVLYKKKLVKVKKLLKKDFSYAVPQSVQDLDLPKLQKTVKVFDFVKWFSKVVKKVVKPEEEDEDEDDDEPADLDPKVDPAVEDVKKGTKKYVTLKWTPTNTLVVDKTGAPTAKFDDLVKDLVDAEKAGEGRYAFYNDNGNLLLVVWAPLTLPDKQKVLYKKKLVKVKKMLKKNFTYVVAESVPELELTKLLKKSKSFDFSSWLLKLLKKFGGEEDEGDDDEPAQLDAKVDSVVEDVKKGTKKYVTLKWTPANTLVVDKTGAPDAKFDDLVKELVAAEKSGEGRYAFYNDKGKLLLIVWTPASVPEAQKVLYKRKLKKLKKLLKKSFFYVITSKVADLNLDALLKSASSFDFSSWVSKFEWKQQIVFGEDSDEGPEDDEPANLDPSTETAIDEVNSGKRKYITTKWTAANTLVVDKSGAAGASFDDLVKELVAAQKAGEGRYAFYHDSDKNKLVILVWIPADVPQKQQTLYKRKFKKVKKLLKRSFSYVILQNASELNLSAILKSLRGLDFGSFFSGQGWQTLNLEHSDSDTNLPKTQTSQSGWTTFQEKHTVGDQGAWQLYRQ